MERITCFHKWRSIFWKYFLVQPPYKPLFKVCVLIQKKGENVASENLQRYGAQININYRHDRCCTHMLRHLVQHLARTCFCKMRPTYKTPTSCISKMIFVKIYL